MEYANIHRSTLQSDMMLEVEPSDGWTWVLLLSYCQQQENSGRIKGAAKWSPRAWMRAAMLEQSAVKKECPLWHLDGEDLVIEFYPHEAEAKVKKQRRGGAKGAAERWHLKTPKPIGNPLGNPLPKPIGNPLGNPLPKPMGNLIANPMPETMPETMGNPLGNLMGEVMRKERKGKEKEGKEREEARTLEGVSDVLIPSLDEVLAWASSGAGVDPAYAEKKWSDTNERHGWVANGQLVDWRKRWKRFWEEDREGWFARLGRESGKREGGKAETDFQKNKNRAEGDAEWWWTEPVEVVSRALHGALLGADPMADRLRVVLECRQRPSGL